MSATLLFDVHDSGLPSAAPNHKYDDIVSDCLHTVAYTAIGIIRHIQPPDMKALSSLRLKTTTPQQKVDGLKALLLLVSQMSALLLVLSVAWRLGMLVTQLVITLLWPLLLLLKVAKWLASG